MLILIFIKDLNLMNVKELVFGYILLNLLKLLVLFLMVLWYIFMEIICLFKELIPLDLNYIRLVFLAGNNKLKDRQRIACCLHDTTFAIAVFENRPEPDIRYGVGIILGITEEINSMVPRNV